MLRHGGAYALLEERGAELASGLRAAADDAGVPVCVQRVGSMMTTFFTEGPVTDFASAKLSDTRRYGAYFRGMAERGVYLAPSQFEAAFLSLAHTHEDIETTLAAASAVFAELG